VEVMLRIQMLRIQMLTSQLGCLNPDLWHCLASVWQA